MVVARPGQPLRLVADPLGSATTVSGAVIATVRRDAEPGEELVLLGSEGAGISAHGVHAQAGVEMRNGHPVLFVDLAAEPGRARVSLAGSDSFLASVLPSPLPDITFDLGLTWSSRDGLALRGGAGFEVTLAAVAELGPLRMEAITLGAAVDDRARGSTSAPASAFTLGPLEARVDDVGVRFTVTAPGSGGNLGPLDLRPRFKPPKGIGLALAAGPVDGGGFLFYDPDRRPVRRRPAAVVLAASRSRRSGC